MTYSLQPNPYEYDEKDERTYVAECDFCDETLDTGDDEYQGGISVLKSEGWKAVKIGGSFKQQCPDCQSVTPTDGVYKGW